MPDEAEVKPRRGRPPGVSPSSLPDGPCIVVTVGRLNMVVTPEIRALLGTAPDAEIGARIGKHRSWVTRARTGLNIPPEYGRKSYKVKTTARTIPIDGLPVLASSLRSVVAARFAEGARSPAIGLELGVSTAQARKLVKGLPVATTWLSLRALLHERGPLTAAELRAAWRPTADRWIGWYIQRGWLIRQSDGTYMVAGGPR